MNQATTIDPKTSIAPRKRGRVALGLGLIALLAGAAYLTNAWVHRPQVGDVEVTLRPLGPHPYDEAWFIYELHVEGVVSGELESGSWIDLGTAFSFRTQRNGEWSEHTPVTRDAAVVDIQDGYAKRLEKTIPMTQPEDRWGNGVERFSGASRRASRLFAPWGSLRLRWETALQVGQEPPERLEVRGRLGEIEFVRVVEVPPQETTAVPVWPAHPDDRKPK